MLSMIALGKRAGVGFALAGILAASMLSGRAAPPASALCAYDSDCGQGGGGCNPCSPSSWCYDPCSNPSLWCYASAGCGGPVCSECNPQSSCYDPCTLTCYDEATCGVGPSDPSPIDCAAMADHGPTEGLMDLGFASVVEEAAPGEVANGSFTLCVDMPASGETRSLFAGDDNSAANSAGIASSVIRNFGLSSATMGGSSLSQKSRDNITKCVQHQLNDLMSGSGNGIQVTTTCPSAESHQPFARVIVGNPSANLQAKLGSTEDGVAAVLPNCAPRDNGVAIVDATRNRNDQERCETIVHEFFHTLGLVHIEDRAPDFQQDTMQNPAVHGQRYKPTDFDGTTKQDGLPRCSNTQNTKKKVREAVAKLVQPVCSDGRCEANKGETCQSCPTDCGGCGGGEPVCGDHNCNGNDTCDNCPQDCGTCGGPGPGGGPRICCEFDPSSNCLYVPCGAGWLCVNGSCSPGCRNDSDCQYLCSDGGLCRCMNGQCSKVSSCACDCSGPFCCPPGQCHEDPGPGGGSGDPIWDWCMEEICRGDWDCADECWWFFAE